jgi:hypothetical protein
MKKKILVIGSGPSGFSALNFLNNKRYILYLSDGGAINDKLKSKIEISKDLSFKYFEPKYQISRNIFNNFYKFNYKNFFNSSSIITGGLSNFWGGGLEKPDTQYLKKHNIDLRNYKKTFNQIDSLLGLSKKVSSVTHQLFKNTIYNFSIKKNNFISLNKNNLALTNKNNNYTIFNTINSLKILIKNKRINYLQNLKINKIIYNNNKYQVFFCNKKYQYFDKIICCAGTIGSTKIVLDLLKIKNIKIRLFHNCMFQLAFFNFSQKFKNLSMVRPNIFIPYLLLKAKVYNLNHSGTLMFGNNFPKNIFKSYLINLFSRFFDKRILVGNFFINQHLSSSYIIKKNDVYEIKYQICNHDVKFNKIKSLIKSFLLSNNFFPIPFLNFKKFKNGSDSHYTSTLYNLKLNNNYILKKNNELIKFKNFFVLDGSTIPPGLNFPTYFCMARAAKIAKSL